MSQPSDLHQISDISSISTISQSSSRFMSRVDSSQSLLDHHSNIAQSANKSVAHQATNPIERVIKSLALCEECMSQHVKANIVYQCVREVSSNCKNVLSESTASKLQTLLLIHKLDKYMHLPSPLKHTQDELTLLGIMDLPMSDLNSTERLDVKCYVETMLRERIHDTISRYEGIGENVKQLSKINGQSMRSKLLECYNMPVVQWKDRIEDLASRYERDILRYAELINKWNELKYEGMSQAYLENAGYLLLQAQVAELQARITKLSCTIRMFRETPTTISAFKALNELIDEKLKAVTDEIQQKQELKKLYDNLRNTEYGQVLETYSQFCNAIKKKKQILEILG